MAGLLSDVLPFLYSQGDRLKRQLGGLLSDPVGSVQQTLGGLLDSAAAQRELEARAFANQRRPFQVTDKQALGQMADNMLAGPLSFAPVGMTAKFTYPQEQALETARQNAVKMLGLPENNTAMDRARALGFQTPAVHFSRHGIDAKELDSGKFAIAPFDAVGTHVGTPEAALSRYNNTVGYKVGNPDYARDEIKASTYPVLIKNQNPMLDAAGKPYAETPLSLSFSEKADYGNLRESNAKLRNDIFSKHDSIPYINDVESPGSISYIVPPQNIRSRFAAFDPARVNENDLLGKADPALLAALGIGTGAALTDEDVRKFLQSLTTP